MLYSICPANALRRALLMVFCTAMFVEARAAEPNQTESGMEHNDHTENVEPLAAEADQIATDTSAQDLLSIRSQLDALESRADAYHIGISELSHDLAGLLVAEGEIDEAMSALQRSLHVSRINYGLDSPRQLPILESIQDLQVLSNQYESAGQTLDRIYRVYQTNYSDNDPKLIDILTRIGVWHLAAYHHRIDRLGFEHLLTANSFLNVAHEQIVNSSFGYNYKLYNLLAFTKHGLATFAGKTSDGASGTNDTVSSQRNEITVSSAYRQGSSLLEHGLDEAHESKDPESLTKAILLYADWNQIFKNRHTARDLYKYAFRAASTLPESHPLRLSFNQPHRLPSFDTNELGLSPEGTDIKEVLIQFDVSDWGISSNIKPIVGDEDEVLNSRVRRAALGTVRSAIYRPAIYDGQPVDFIGVNQTVVVQR